MENYDINKARTSMSFALKPRERVSKQGIRALSDSELIALLMGTGNGNKGVMSLSKEVLNLMENRNYTFSQDDLASIKGVGNAKSSLLMAVFEIVRRHSQGNTLKVNSPEIVQKILFHYADRPKEYFFTLTLNGAHELINRHIISTGNLNRVFVSPREVFIEAIKDRSAAIILAHNHPSGSLEPSPEDIKMTRSLQSVSKLLAIPLLDHVIFSRSGYYSFVEQGNLP